jgi:hypothetical protein
MPLSFFALGISAAYFGMGMIVAAIIGMGRWKI